MRRHLRRRVLDNETLCVALDAVHSAVALVRWPCLAPGCFAKLTSEGALLLHRLQEHPGLAFLEMHGTARKRTQRALC